MNVVRFIRSFPSYEKISYGLAPAFYYISREQVRHGVNIHVICKRSSHEKKFEKIEGIQIHRVVSPYGLSALNKLIELKRNVKIDVVHAHATSCLSYAVLRRFLRGTREIKYIVHVHGTTRGVMSAYRKFIPEFSDQIKWRQHAENLLSSLRQHVMWKRADALIAVSQSVADELVNSYGIAKERISVVSNGVDLEVFHHLRSRAVILERLGLDTSSRVILYLGGFRLLKGPKFLIQAAKIILEELENAQIIFVGNPQHPLEKPYVETMLNLIKKLRLNDMLHVVKNIPYIQMPQYMSAADVLVVPSIYEASPKVLFEAMACGTPVVATAVGGIRDIVTTGETGMLVKPGNSNALAEAIIKTLSNPDLRKKISLNCKNLVKEQFTWAHVSERIIRIYKELCGSPS